MGLRHFLTLADLNSSELQALIKRGIEIKSGLQKGELYQPLKGKVLAMIFEKSSTRTRVSFEAGMAQFGGHAIFIDARKMLPHIPPLQYPGQSLAIALYLQGGIRCAEIGSFMFGRQTDGSEKPASMELVRLAMPRRVYTQAQADYIVECFEALLNNISEVPGMLIDWEPSSLRHFTARLRPIKA